MNLTFDDIVMESEYDVLSALLNSHLKELTLSTYFQEADDKSKKASSGKGGGGCYQKSRML